MHRAGEHDDRDQGSITVATLFGVATVTVIAVMVANVLAFQFGRAAVRVAIDDGVRVAARATPGSEVAVCEQVANASISQLAGGLGNGVSISCASNGEIIQATASVHFQGWLGGVSDHTSTIQASAALENQL